MNKEWKDVTEQDLIDLMTGLIKHHSENPQYLAIHGNNEIEKLYKEDIKWNKELFTPKGLSILGFFK